MGIRESWVGLRSRLFADFDASAERWGPGWLRWPVGRHGLLVAVLLVLKLAITAWNCGVFDSITYDQGDLHVPRARDAGLGTEGRAYNPPLYYMATAPTLAVHAVADRLRDSDERLTKKQRKRRDRQLLATLRWSNLGYLALFYLAWIGAILPRLIRDRRRAWIAALVLLALPGYQKLAAMSHPDNALSSLTAVGIATWLVLRDDDRPLGRRIYLLAAAAGFVALTRPFGVLPCGALLVACVLLLAREHGWRSRAFVTRVAGCVALTGALAGSWPAVQLATQGGLSPVYKQSYLEPYLPHRADFDRVGYFSSFHVGELLTIPNRRMNQLDTVHDEFHNDYGNSFWTLLYSETWADHWLYFSGRYQVENKAAFKRVMLAAALPTLPLMLLGFARGVGASVGRIRRWRDEAEADTALFMLSFLALGVALYLYWHLVDGLTPGKNSSVKFIYNAYLYPVALALTFVAPLRRFEDRVWPAYAVALFVISLPVVVFVPAWLIR